MAFVTKGKQRRKVAVKAPDVNMFTDTRTNKFRRPVYDNLHFTIHHASGVLRGKIRNIEICGCHAVERDIHTRERTKVPATSGKGYTWCYIDRKCYERSESIEFEKELLNCFEFIPSGREHCRHECMCEDKEEKRNKFTEGLCISGFVPVCLFVCVHDHGRVLHRYASHFSTGRCDQGLELMRKI